MWGWWSRGETEEMEKLRARRKVEGRLRIDHRVCINSVTGPWLSLNGLSSALMVYDTSRTIWLNYGSSIDRSIIWLLYSPASSSYKGKLWWQGMLSWHFLSGANQCKSWIAFVDISQGEQHGRYHCRSLIAVKRQKRRDKHTWIYNVQPFELGRDEDYFQIKHACILTPYIPSFQAVPLISTFTEQALMLPKAAALLHLTQGQRHAGLVIW